MVWGECKVLPTATDKVLPVLRQPPAFPDLRFMTPRSIAMPFGQLLYSELVIWGASDKVLPVLTSLP